jgi:hypothetical protein
MTRIVPMFLAASYVLALATEAQATLNACTSAKEACVAKKTAALLKCHSKNSKPPAGLAPAKFAACVQKAKDKFDGGANPAKGCFAKLEAKYGVGGCLTAGDVAALETQVDDFVDAVICALDPAAGTCPVVPTPTPMPTPSCSNGLQDGVETGVDCGGGDCPACSLGGSCNTNDDCMATTVCSASTCVCAAGLSDCNVNPGDGCETNTSTNVANCGACNSVCTPPNAAPVCSAGQCQIDSCIPGYADCDSMVVTGCEVDTDSDDDNCGSCGFVCPGVQTCVNGFCQ